MIEMIKDAVIAKAFEHSHRQYLVGDLRQAQELQHLHESNVEVGITEYKTFGWEKPHYHPIACEYQMILEGVTKYIDISEDIEIEMKKGDFFIIRPNTQYIQKSQPGCKILFFKYPAGNDKKVLPLTDRMKEWISLWEKEWDTKKLKKIQNSPYLYP